MAVIIEYLFAHARKQEIEDSIRKSPWLRWPSRPGTNRKVRGL